MALGARILPIADAFPPPAWAGSKRRGTFAKLAVLMLTSYSKVLCYAMLYYAMTSYSKV